MRGRDRSQPPQLLVPQLATGREVQVKNVV